MLVTINKVVKETFESKIEINLPAFLKDGDPYPDYYMICEDETVVKVSSIGSILKFTATAKEKIAEIVGEYTYTTEEKFFEAYNKALDNIHNSVMPLPVI